MICPKCFYEHSCTVCPRCGGFIAQPKLEVSVPQDWAAYAEHTISRLNPAVHKFEIPECCGTTCSKCPLLTYEGNGLPNQCVFGWSNEDSWRNMYPSDDCLGPGNYKIVRT